jgi:hypothetical protein
MTLLLLVALWCPVSWSVAYLLVKRPGHPVPFENIALAPVQFAVLPYALIVTLSRSLRERWVGTKRRGP